MPNAWDIDPRDPDDLAAAARDRAERPGLGGRASVALLCLVPVGVLMWVAVIWIVMRFQ